MIAVYFILAYTALGQSSATLSTTQHAASSSYVANATVEELSGGYLKWIGAHPKAVPADKRLKVLVPILDLFSPSGISLYHGEDSVANAAFLRTFPKGMDGPKQVGLRPSLKEAIEMFSELRSKEDALLADKRYTIFAITYLDWEPCKDQNEAVSKLRERKGQANMRVIEVRLHK
jgi:hypothetical protein